MLPNVGTGMLTQHLKTHFLGTRNLIVETYSLFPHFELEVLRKCLFNLRTWVENPSQYNKI